MSLEFPWAAYAEAQRRQDQNRKDMNQNMAGLGQSLGQDFNTIGQQIEEAKKKQILQQIVTAMQNQGAPQQGPQPEGMTQPPLSGMGAPPQDNTNQINSLMMQYDPKDSIKTLYKEKQQSPWAAVANMMSPDGNPIQQNKHTGEMRVVPLKITPTGRGNSAFGSMMSWPQMSPELQYLGKQLYEGNQELGKLGYRERSQGAVAANEYARVNGLAPYKSYTGDVAAGTAKMFGTGKLGQNALALNTALGHTSSAYDAYQKIDNTNQAWLNKPLNVLRKETSDPNVIALDTTLTALRGELANVFKTSGATDQEIAQWRDNLGNNLTPSQINAVIPQVDDLLRSRLSALDYQRQSGMSGRGEMPLLSPKGAEISKRFGKNKKPAKANVTNFSVTP